MGKMVDSRLHWRIIIEPVANLLPQIEDVPSKINIQLLNENWLDLIQHIMISIFKVVFKDPRM